jgi:secretion/DNA translocation related TadE-like protein
VSGRERGATTIVMIGVVALGFALIMGAARLGTAVVARARADTAADAAALAAADMLALGRDAGAAEAAARDTAAANGGRLVSCSCAGRFASVVIEVAVGSLGASARATAKAEVRDDAFLPVENGPSAGTSGR